MVDLNVENYDGIFMELILLVGRKFFRRNYHKFWMRKSRNSINVLFEGSSINDLTLWDQKFTPPRFYKGNSVFLYGCSF